MAELPNENIHSQSLQSDRMTGKDRIGRTILATFIAALGPLSFGYCFGYSSSALIDLQNDNAPSGVRLSTEQGSWFSSLVNVGAMFGSLIGGWAIDKFGRKGTIMLCAIPFELGWLLISYAQNVAMLYTGRIITGLGCGVISLAVPVYIAEIAAARLRGALGCVNQLAITLGLLLGYVCGVLLHWRWLALIGAVLPALLIILMIPMPETPRWSLGKKQGSEASKALLWLRGSDFDIEDECCTIKASLDEDHHERIPLRELLLPVILKPLIVSIGLMVFQQFSGANAVLFNAADIFATAGFSNGKLVSIAVGLVQFVGAGLACLLMDKVGRRIILLANGLGMCVSLVALGVYFDIYIPPKDDSSVSDAVSLLGSISHSVPANKISWLSILCIVLFNLMYAFAWGPVPWLVMSEIFPLRARGLACGIATLTNWTMSFVVTRTYQSMSRAFNIQGVYWFYSGCCLLGFSFVYFLLPETKGKTLEEMEAIFDRGKRNYERID